MVEEILLSNHKSYYKKRFIFNWTPYDDIISNITQSHSNLTYFTKAKIILDKFSRIKRTKSQIQKLGHHKMNAIKKISNK